MTKQQIEKLISDYANELIGPGDLTNEELDAMLAHMNPPTAQVIPFPERPKA